MLPCESLHGFFHPDWERAAGDPIALLSRQRSRQGDRGSKNLALFAASISESNFNCTHRVNRFSQPDHFQCQHRIDQSGEELSPPRPRQETKFDFGQTELSSPGDNPSLAGHRQFQAATEGLTVDCGYNRLTGGDQRHDDLW